MSPYGTPKSTNNLAYLHHNQLEYGYFNVKYIENEITKTYSYIIHASLWCKNIEVLDFTITQVSLTIAKSHENVYNM